MENSLRIQFDSRISNIGDVNESFSSGVMRICYAGKNRNGSDISKDAIERAIPTMFNCPVVCHYDIDTDEIGGHDVDFVPTDDGTLKMIHLTDAVGVVPSGAESWWEPVEEDDGVVRDYFSTEVILWKRSPAYQKIVEDGIVSQSMEILVKEAQLNDGILDITNFVFTAFCLLGEGVEPCFESASLQMFSERNVEAQFAQMVQELKQSFALTKFSKEMTHRVNINSQIISEGGIDALEDKNALMAEFGLTADMLDFNIEEFSVEELRARFEEMNASAAAPATDGNNESFALEGEFRAELIRTLEQETIETCWGVDSHYWFWDYDRELSEVYAYDVCDFNIYGLAYSMDGDHVVIDFTSKKRMKLALIPFDEGSQEDPMAAMFTKVVGKYTENNEQWREKYQVASDEISSLGNEIASLRQFKEDTEAAFANNERENVFAQFEDLNGIEAFETLKNNCSELSAEELEDKCFAIRGRNVAHNFSAQKPKSPRLPIEKNKFTDEPYGGLFVEFPPIH